MTHEECVEHEYIDDTINISAKYREIFNVSSIMKAEALAYLGLIHHIIGLKADYQLPYSPIYNLSEVQLWTLIAYSEANTANRYVKWSLLLATAAIRFTKKT